MRLLILAGSACLGVAMLATHAIAAPIVYTTPGFRSVTLDPGTYYIQAIGASGGGDYSQTIDSVRGYNGTLGGLGAIVGGFFSFRFPERLEILVGGQGTDGSPTEPGFVDGGGGGGGGSYVVNLLQTSPTTAQITPLLIAGGGGGSDDAAGGNARAPEVTGGGFGGTAVQFAGGGGGGGLLANGANSPGRFSNGGGGSFVSGGGRGISYDGNNNGGIGGGGSGGTCNVEVYGCDSVGGFLDSGGGGGGYTGGNAGSSGLGSTGGSSFDGGTSPAFSIASTRGNGSVRIVEVEAVGDSDPTDIPEPASFALLIVGVAGVIVMRQRRPA